MTSITRIEVSTLTVDPNDVDLGRFSPRLGTEFTPMSSPTLSPIGTNPASDPFHLRRLSRSLPDSRPFPAQTKIICTIGPATNTIPMLTSMIEEGMKCARLNFSHGTHEYHASVIENIRKSVLPTKRLCPIMLDTKGPEIRTGKVEGGAEVELKQGQQFQLVCGEEIEGDEKRAFILYPNLPKILKPGNRILIDDGLIEMRVSSIESTNVNCIVVNSGKLGSSKGVNLPGVIVDLPAVTSKDVADIEFGIQQGVDFIAASFVRNAECVQTIRKILGTAGSGIKIISKIENQEGLDNFDEILSASDGIMAARGDLGVEIPIEQVCLAQKMMIRKCNLAGKFVITATQMLDSMISNPSPTRAEASDVANAVFDGTDCVMLSGETAKGKYPILAIRMMGMIVREAEDNVDHVETFNAIRSSVPKPLCIPEAISSSAVKTALDLRASLLIVLTESGTTGRFVAKYRPSVPVLCITSSEQTARQALLSRGLMPLLVGSMMGSDSLITRVINVAKKLGMCSKGDIVVATVGSLDGKPGTTSQLKVLTVL